MRIARGISVTNISKPISTAIVYDADAVAFFTAASITDTTQKSAVNQLVLDLKSASIWTKMKALYPIVGGVASSHAVNLKTPGTYNLSFSTGWTHASTGMTPLNAYADTYFVPSSDLTLYNGHASCYSRTSTFKTGTFYLLGTYHSVTQGFGIYATSSTSTFGALQYSINVTTDIAIASSLPNKQGFFINNRTSSTATTLKLFKNGTSIGNATTSTAGQTRPTTSIYLGAVRDVAGGGSPAFYDNGQMAFYSFGDGLTDAEASAFYTAVQTFQTTLGRQI